MPSTDRKLELTAEASMAQPISQPAVCSNGLRILLLRILSKDPEALLIVSKMI